MQIFVRLSSGVKDASVFIIYKNSVETNEIVGIVNKPLEYMNGCITSLPYIFVK